MKNNKFMIIFAFSITLFLFSFVLGYSFIGKSVERNMAKDNLPIGEKSVDLNEYEDIHIIKDENMISPNTFIEMRTSYKECGHLVSNIISPDEEIINMGEEEYKRYLENNYPNLKLISFSNEKIVIWGERNHLCEKHLVLGEEDGKIAVFKIGENGERIVEKVFETYSLNMLIPLDREKLEEGIVVDTEEELSNLLENFIS